MRAWLERNHDSASEVLSFGWIDGIRKNRDAVFSAKREETRQRRLATLIEDSANGRRIRQLIR